MDILKQNQFITEPSNQPSQMGFCNLIKLVELALPRCTLKQVQRIQKDGIIKLHRASELARPPDRTGAFTRQFPGSLSLPLVNSTNNIDHVRGVGIKSCMESAWVNKHMGQVMLLLF